MQRIRYLFLACCLLAGPLQAAWQIETVDPGGGGKFSSLRIDRYGNVHVAYFDPAAGLLKYAFRDHVVNKWFTTAVDKSSGFCSMVLDSRSRPRISYDEYDTGRLKYAYWDGSTWRKQTIQLSAKNISYYTSIVVDSQDRPSISFYEYLDAAGDTAIRLREISWDGKVWELRTADPEMGSGKFNSLLVDSAGRLHIAYANVKYEGASIRYATWNGKSWETEFVEGSGGTGYSAYSVFAVLDKNDIAHITYTDVRDRSVKYATKINGKWRVDVVDSVSKVAYPDRNGLVFDSSGVPYVSYYDAGLGVLKLAHLVHGKWLLETVDQNFAGYTSSLQIYDGTIWISYADENSASLKVARRKLDDPMYDNTDAKSYPIAPKPQGGGRN